MNEQMNEFSSLQDSIKVREEQIARLKRRISRRGRASHSESEQLNQMLSEIDGFLVQHEELAAELDSAGIHNATQQEVVRILLTSVRDKQEQIEELKYSVRELQQRVEGLEVDNANLLTKTMQLEQKSDSLAQMTDELEDMANRLTLYDFDYEVPENAFGKDKKANKIDDIRFCFSFNENRFVKAGTKMVYIRIIAPDGYVLDRADDKVFEFQGEGLGYTLEKEVRYNPSDKQRFCTRWKRSGEKLGSGKYGVSLYVDGKKMGEKVMVLR